MHRRAGSLFSGNYNRSVFVVLETGAFSINIIRTLYGVYVRSTNYGLHTSLDT